jgi:hypothetical protein
MRSQNTEETNECASEITLKKMKRKKEEKIRAQNTIRNTRKRV